MTTYCAPCLADLALVRDAVTTVSGTASCMAHAVLLTHPTDTPQRRLSRLTELRTTAESKLGTASQDDVPTLELLVQEYALAGAMDMTVPLRDIAGDRSPRPPKSRRGRGGRPEGQREGGRPEGQREGQRGEGRRPAAGSEADTSSSSTDAPSAPQGSPTSETSAPAGGSGSSAAPATSSPATSEAPTAPAPTAAPAASAPAEAQAAPATAAPAAPASSGGENASAPAGDSA